MKIMRRKLTAIAGFFFVASGTVWSAPPAGGVEIWIRSFIPDIANAGKAGDFIVARPGEPGKSMVRILPFSAPGPSCYVTDNRGYSTSELTSARQTTRFSISLNGAGGKVLPSENRTTVAHTEEVRCSDGVGLAIADGKVERDTVGVPAYADGAIQVAGQITTKNILAVWGNGPSIDNTFDIQWSPWMGKLKSKISHGSFPAVEVYARADVGEWQPIVRSLPTGSPWNLAGDDLGIGYSNDSNEIVLPSVTGTWKTSDPSLRFELTVLDGKFSLKERGSTGAILVKAVSSELQADGSMRITRANDVEVLTFLGFQPTLRSQILARSPRPSYIDLSFSGSSINAQWYGLQVTKDANANLKDLIQPGERPPKLYVLAR